MRNAIALKWWGVEVLLDETNTQQLLTLADSGGDVVALLCAIDPELKSKLALGLAAALVKIGGKIIKAVDENGGKQGVCISHPWVGPIPGWVTAQAA